MLSSGSLGTRFFWATSPGTLANRADGPACTFRRCVDAGLCPQAAPLPTPALHPRSPPLLLLIRLRLRLRLRMPWPLPALLAWGGGWAVWQLILGQAGPAHLAWLAGLATGSLLALAGCQGAWRRALGMLGFPLATLALGGLPALPAWAWLLAAAPWLLLYPVGAWRDAPFFPTPADALHGLNQLPGLAVPRQVLDAGCGLGHGLRALRGQWPQAQFDGLERSRLLRLAAALRCPWARLSTADMWVASWAAYDVVYLFQRPESMARALVKAQQDMAPGGWLVSLMDIDVTLSSVQRVDITLPIGAQETRIEDQMNLIFSLLNKEQPQLGEAIDRQEELVGQLKNLLDLLQSRIDVPRSKKKSCGCRSCSRTSIS